MTDLRDILSKRRIIAFEGTLPAGHAEPRHSHSFSQLTFSLSGVMSVKTARTSYVLPPNRALWLPAGTPHETINRGEVRYQAVYVDASAGKAPADCRVFEVSSLIRGLVDEAIRFDGPAVPGSREARLTALLLDELERMPASLNVGAVMPEDGRLRRVCDRIIASPSDNRDVAEWAKLAGMGQRTFSRHFRQQTGMGFGLWRQQARLMEAVSRLLAGEAITSVAYEVGYESPSAFAAMFHRTFGVPPRDFRNAAHPG